MKAFLFGMGFISLLCCTSSIAFGSPSGFSIGTNVYIDTNYIYYQWTGQTRSIPLTVYVNGETSKLGDVTVTGPNTNQTLHMPPYSQDVTATLPVYPGAYTYTANMRCQDGSTSTDSETIYVVKTTFPGKQSVRACAGAINDIVHESTVTVNLITNTAFSGKTVDISYDITGCNYAGHIAPTFLNAQGTAVSTLSLLTDANGNVSFTSLSSDVISQPQIVVELSGVELGRIGCDFADEKSIRRFPDPNDPDDPSWTTNDTGWICDTEQFTNPGSSTPAKVYVKFMKEPSLGNVDGNWYYVNNHSVMLTIASVTLYDGQTITNPSTITQYLFMVDPANGSHTSSLMVMTANDGAAQVIVHAGSLIDDLQEIEFAAVDQTQVSN